MFIQKVLIMSNNKEKYYIGLTGFTSIDEINAIKEYWDIKLFNSIDLMVGFLLNDKVLNGGFHNSRYVILRDLPRLFKASKGLFRVLHYNTKVKDFSSSLIDKIEKLSFEGIQLNIFNPEPNEIKNLIDNLSIRIIYQLKMRFFNGLSDIKEWVSQFSKVDLDILKKVDFLLDFSEGKGIPISNESLRLIPKIKNYLLNNEFYGKIGIAGGLSYDNIESYLSRVNNVSVDCESSIRNENGNSIDINKAKKFIDNSILCMRFE